MDFLGTSCLDLPPTPLFLVSTVIQSVLVDCGITVTTLDYDPGLMVKVKAACDWKLLPLLLLLFSSSFMLVVYCCHAIIHDFSPLVRIELKTTICKHTLLGWVILIMLQCSLKQHIRLSFIGGGGVVPRSWDFHGPRKWKLVNIDPRVAWIPIKTRSGIVIMLLIIHALHAQRHWIPIGGVLS